MKKLLIYSLSILFSSIALTQTSEVDSLLKLLEIYQQDTNRVRVLHQLTTKVRKYDLKTAETYAKEGFALSEKLDDKLGQCPFYVELGMIYLGLGDYEKALRQVLEGATFCEEQGNIRMQSSCFFLAGYLEVINGNVEKASDYYQKSMELSQASDYVNGIIRGYKGMGDVAENQGNYAKALEHYEAGMAIAKAENIRAQEMVLHNSFGIVYDNLGLFDKALENFLATGTIAEELNNIIAAVGAFSNVADIYSTQNEFQKALDIHLKAMEMAQQSGYKNALSGIYNDIGLGYRALGKSSETFQYLELARQSAEEMGN